MYFTFIFSEGSRKPYVSLLLEAMAGGSVWK